MNLLPCGTIQKQISPEKSAAVVYKELPENNDGFVIHCFSNILKPQKVLKRAFYGRNKFSRICTLLAVCTIQAKSGPIMMMRQKCAVHQLSQKPQQANDSVLEGGQQFTNYHEEELVGMTVLNAAAKFGRLVA